MSADTTRCAVCGGEFLAKRVIIDGRSMHRGCAVMSYPPHTSDDAARMTNTIVKLRDALEAIVKHAELNGMQEWQFCKRARKALQDGRGE